MDNWTPEEIMHITDEIQAKSMLDPSFRKQVLEKPCEIISQIAGKPVPEGFKIKVIEADPEFDQTFVLPPMISQTLSDEELDGVAGGGLIQLSGDWWVKSGGRGWGTGNTFW